ncbi:MAG: SDR family oxidoreductase [Bryobacter sp.]|jgi:NAD(P)-dependent dehydrogenase (short-subunit alcohol dehydrogenase family)|nr:SDR family oxidoreductase [Bryobacter sp. CoA8 C33]
MELSFKGMTALVTGAAGGIGRATVGVLAGQGSRVWALDRVGLEQEGVEVLTGDLRGGVLLEEAIARAGRVDVAVLNAGICRPAELEQTTAANWDETIAVNLSAVFHHLQRLAGVMKKQRGGSIVITASTNSFDGEAGLIAYNASKAGLLGIVHTAANELGPYGVRVNAVCPGLIETPLTREAFDRPEVIQPYFAALPLGRGGQPEEVARAIAFLASDWASYVTGATLFVDGGQMAAKFGTWTEEKAEFAGGRWRLKPEP